MSGPSDLADARDQAERWFAWLSGMVVFHAALQTIAIGLSLAKVSLKSPVAETTVLVSIGLGYASWRWFRPAASRGVAAGGFRRASLLPKAILVAAGVTYLAAWIVSWFRPDTSCDANLYHVPTMHFWAYEGYVHWIDWSGELGPFMNGYPSGVELTGLMLSLALHTSRLTDAINLAFLPLGVLGLAYLARAIGASALWAAVAGAAWVLIPMNVAQSTTAYVDSAYASCVVALFAAAFYALSHVGRDGEFFPWRVSLPLGASAGLAAAAKATGPMVAAVAFAALLGSFWAAVVSAPPPRSRRALAAVGLVVATAAVAVLVGGYWDIRNWLIADSPLYPVGVSIAGYELFPGRTLENTVGVSASTPLALRSMSAWKQVLMSWAEMGVPPYTPWGCWPRAIWTGEGGLGYLWLLGCMPALVWVLASAAGRNWRAGLPIFVLVLIVGTAFLLQPMNWSARYTLWIYAAGLPCLALIASRTSHNKGGRAWAVRLWLSVCLLVLLVEGVTVLTRIVPIALRPSNTWACLERHYWGRPQCYLMPELSGTVFDQIFAGHDAVAVGPLRGHTRDGGHFKVEILGQLSLPLGGRRILSVDQPIDEKTLARLADQGVRYLILDGDCVFPEAVSRGGFVVHRAGDFCVVVLEGRMPEPEESTKSSQAGA